MSTQQVGQDQPETKAQNMPTEAETSKQLETKHDSQSFLDLISFDVNVEEGDEDVKIEQEQLDEAETEANEIVIEKDDTVTHNYFSESGIILND